ncbi:MAG: hypothetical protein ACLVI9_14030 [Anaerostipes hadrus]
MQNNNPEVPGLVYKLTPTEEKVRKLKSKRSLARYHGSSRNQRCLYWTTLKGKYDIDHSMVICYER